MAKITIKGLNELLKKIDRFNVALNDEVDDVIVAGAYQMNSQAQRNIQAQGLIDKGALLAGQQVVKGEGRGYSVTNTVPYSAYHEFGTGGLVRVDPEWAAIAAEFKGKGLRVVNIRPRPFFIPAFNQVSPQIVQDVQDVINDALK